jgi:transcriptional regulator GlxA family with amidase domain
MSSRRTPGFRLGIYVFKDAEIVDFAAPHGVLSVARRFDPEIDAFLVADASRPVQTQAGFTVLPNYSFADRPALDAFLIPGGFGTRQEMHNRRLHEFIRAPGSTVSWASSTACRRRTARSRTASSPDRTARSPSTGWPRSPPPVG